MKTETLEKVIHMTEKELLEWLPDPLGVPVVQNEKYVYKAGTVPILLVCHLDTVHSRPPTAKEICENDSGSIWTAPTCGIGGDDRCGVAAVIELLKSYDCSAVFTTGEETGGKGALAFAEDFKGTAFNFAIEIDRKGRGDAVFYNCDNPEFTSFVLEDSFYSEQSGSFTDISYICPSLGMAGVNLSSGYYSPHTLGEYISIKDWLACIDHAAMLIERGKDKPFEYVEKKFGGFAYGSGRYLYDEYKLDHGFHDYYSRDDKMIPMSFADDKCPCDHCHVPYPYDDLTDTGTEYLCPDCLADEFDEYAEYCDYCERLSNDWHETPSGQVVCSDCAKTLEKQGQLFV